MAEDTQIPIIDSLLAFKTDRGNIGDIVQVNGQDYKLVDPKIPGLWSLAVIPNIDVTQTGAIPIYTPPEGKRVVIALLGFHSQDVSGFISDGTFTVGDNPSNYDDLSGSQGFGVTDNNSFAILSNSPTSLMQNQVKLNITGGVTATKALYTCVLFGYIV
jgi:hypothetical protein